MERKKEKAEIIRLEKGGLFHKHRALYSNPTLKARLTEGGRNPDLHLRLNEHLSRALMLG